MCNRWFAESINLFHVLVCFRRLVDASQAGEGQLEISINDGEVPNHVQVLGGGKCLVSFTPEAPKIHTIEVPRCILTLVVPITTLLLFHSLFDR